MARIVIKDQLQRTIRLHEVPKRIVSLVPSQTELIVALGLIDSLVGITKFCVHPAKLRKEVAVVGGTKSVRLEKIKALSPDLIICNKEENTKDIVSSCESIAPVWVSDIYTLEDCLEMIRKLGIVLSASERASLIINDINKELQSFTEFIKDKPKKKCAYLIWKNPYMMAGKQTFINDVLRLNRFETIAYSGEARYPEVTTNDLHSADVVFLSSEPFPFKEEHINELKQELDGEVVLVDGEYFSWYGSRLVVAFSYFRTLH